MNRIYFASDDRQIIAAVREMADKCYDSVAADIIVNRITEWASSVDEVEDLKSTLEEVRTAAG